MRQYASQQGGTMMSSQRGKEPLDNVIDRVMAIAKRLIVCETTIKNQAKEIASLKETIKTLNEQVEDYTAPSIVKEAKAPKTRSARRRKPSAATKQAVAKLTDTPTES